MSASGVKLILKNVRWSTARILIFKTFRFFDMERKMIRYVNLICEPKLIGLICAVKIPSDLNN